MKREKYLNILIENGKVDLMLMPSSTYNKTDIQGRISDQK